MNLSSLRRTVPRQLRPLLSWDALLFWATFSSSILFILWIFNNTTKEEFRQIIQQRILTSTRNATTLLDPVLGGLPDGKETPPPSPAEWLQDRHALLKTFQQGNPDVDQIWVATTASNKTLLTPADPAAPALPKNLLPELGAAVRRTQSTGSIVLSNWAFLRKLIFFFFTPPHGGIEYSIQVIPGWEHLPKNERPAVLLLFNAERMQGELVELDNNSARIVAVAILLATVLGIIAHRRSTERAEAIEQKLATLRTLRQRDSIMGAAVNAAERFISFEDLSEPVHDLLCETCRVVQAQASYLVTLDDDVRRSFIMGGHESMGVLPETHQPFNPALLERPEWKQWKEMLQQGQAIVTTLSTAHPGEKPRLKELGVKSIAILPVLAEHRLVALVVLAHGRNEIHWDPGLITTFKLTTNILGSAIARYENEHRLRESSKMTAMGRMAGGVAHEFNNLLHVVTGNLSNLAHRLSERPEEAAMVEKIHTASLRGSKIIDQLLRATRQSKADLHPGSLNQLVERTVELADAAIKKNVDFMVHLADDLPAVLIDEGMMQQVVLNLLLNARDAIDEGGIIHISTYRSTRIRNQREELFVCCAIRDNGSGIPPEIINTIFDPFFTTKPPGSGTGLGLSTSRGILAQHHGSLEASNHPDGGAVFTLSLPALKEHAADFARQVLKPQENTFSHNQTVLVADDERLCRELAQDILNGYGMKCMGASDGDQLLALAKKHGKEVNWIVSDWNMPGLNGPELARALKKEVPEARLIITSGFIIEDEHQGLADGVLHKPFDPDQLLSLMQKLS